MHLVKIVFLIKTDYFLFYYLIYFLFSKIYKLPQKYCQKFELIN